MEESGSAANAQQLSPQDNDSNDDEEMSDAESEADEPQQQPPPPSQPLPQPARRHDHLLNQQIIAAWQQGHALDPEIEQFLKEQSERGTLHADLDVVSNFHPRALRGYLRPAAGSAGAGSSGASAAVAGSAAA